MKVASNVKIKPKKKVTAAGPGDEKKSNAPESARDSKKYSEFREKDYFGRNPREKANAQKAANGTFASGAAPRVGGTVAKSTTVYTGQGAVPGAKKLKKAPTKSVVIRRKKAI